MYTSISQGVGAKKVPSEGQRNAVRQEFFDAAPNLWLKLSGEPRTSYHQPTGTELAVHGRQRGRGWRQHVKMGTL